jgi:tripartite-type tricarboxylate transporter receptor subunit TctC
VITGKVFGQQEASMRNRLQAPFCSNRRRLLRLAAGAVALPAVSRVAWAQAYPTRPVRIIVPLAPAGTVDIMARLMGQWLSERLGQQFVIENRPGAGSTVGTEAVVRAHPDGYTLLMIDVSAAFNAALYDKLSFNFIRDIAPVANVVRVPHIIAVHPSFPAKTVPEFIAYAKANPGKISMATAGVGSSTHVFGELFKMMAGVNLVAVPYRGGGPALVDMLSGQVNVIFVPTPASIEYVRAGRLRALGVTSTTRVEILPDLPPVAEFVPGYEASSWVGLCAPRDTPVEIVGKLNREINAGLSDPKIKAQFVDMGGAALPGSPADFGKLIARETEKWANVIRAANIKPD